MLGCSCFWHPGQVLAIRRCDDEADGGSFLAMTGIAQ
jgi:hypothetical protein